MKAFYSLADLVHLVDEYQRIFNLSLLQALNQFTRHCAHIGAAMSLDLSNVCHAAHTKAEVLAIQSACNGLCYACLAHTRRSMKAQDLALRRALEGTDGNKF